MTGLGDAHRGFMAFIFLPFAFLFSFNFVVYLGFHCVYLVCKR